MIFSKKYDDLRLDYFNYQNDLIFNKSIPNSIVKFNYFIIKELNSSSDKVQNFLIEAEFLYVIL